MDLNKIELPANVVVELYKDSLIGSAGSSENTLPREIAEPKQAPGPATPAVSYNWKSLGNNQKNILIVVDHNDLVNLPDADLTFLTGILNACGLSLADVAIINLNNYKETGYKALTTHFKSRNVFLFGIGPATFGLPMDFPHFQVQSFQQCSYLYSPALKELETMGLPETHFQYLILFPLF
jgi:hypothetical protein